MAAESRTVPPTPIQTSEEIDLLLSLLPEPLYAPLSRTDTHQLLEVVLDLGRLPEARFLDRTEILSQDPVHPQELEHVTHRIGEFGGDNRVGIPRTLHRISAIRNRRGVIIGLTLRVGRTVFGTIDLIRDLVGSGKNLLLLGRPGVGKTTKLRETARLLADDFGKRVIVVDTSNEIGGDGDVPHPAIGSARRMQVPRPDQQHSVMIEAVENHMPEVIIVDEIGTQAEAAAARTIAERGVQLIGTAHGTTLENLILNPTLADLIGGIHTVTLSDEEARRQRRPKTITERRGPPTFDVVIELIGRDEVIVHLNTAEAVDTLLLGRQARGEHRSRNAEGEVQKKAEEHAPSLPVAATIGGGRPATPSLVREDSITRIFAFEIERDLLERVIRNLRIPARTVRHPEIADILIASRSNASDPILARICEQVQAPLHLIKKGNATSMRKALQDIFSVLEGMNTDEVREAVSETEHALQRALNEKVDVELAPRPSPIRKMQHRMIARYHLEAESVGSEPMRHLVIHPPAA